MKNKTTFTEEELKSYKDSMRMASFIWLKENRPELTEHNLNSYFLEDRNPSTIYLKFDLAIGEKKKENS